MEPNQVEAGWYFFCAAGILLFWIFSWVGLLVSMARLRWEGKLYLSGEWNLTDRVQDFCKQHDWLLPELKKSYCDCRYVVYFICVGVFGLGALLLPLWVAWLVRCGLLEIWKG